MKPIRFINHAEERRIKREISQESIIETIIHPDKIEPSWENRSIYMRIFFDRDLEQKMLLRVAIEETQDEIIVISVYKTSKINKYLKGDIK
jgi:hypothetical protein